MLGYKIIWPRLQHNGASQDWNPDLWILTSQRATHRTARLKITINLQDSIIGSLLLKHNIYMWAVKFFRSYSEESHCCCVPSDIRNGLWFEVLTTWHVSVIQLPTNQRQAKENLRAPWRKPSHVSFVFRFTTRNNLLRIFRRHQGNIIQQVSVHQDMKKF